MFNLEDYEPVEVRLEKFWKEYPDGRVYTELLESSPTRFVVFSSIYRTEADAHPWATGLASETISDRGMLSTSALEVCETSSLGRALANAGYSAKVKGGNGKRPSREEMISATKANLQEPKKEYIPVENAEDPWTIKAVEMPNTIDKAVDTVKEIIGGQTERDIPKCPTCTKDMIWKHGTTKAGKAWGHFQCKRAVGSGICDQVIWYEISPSGAWVKQKERS